MQRRFKQVDSGITRSVWAVDASKSIFRFYRGKWTKISGRLDHVSSGQSGVWGTVLQKNRKGLIYYRTGVSRRRPLGLRWRRIGGLLQQIDSGPRGIVCGKNIGNRVYCRRAISRRYPYGKGWVMASGASIKYVSIGQYGMWGVSKSGVIYFRQGMSRRRPWGYKWKRISGRLNQIEAGKFGQVYGVTKNGYMYVRTGVTQRRPWGRSWKRIKSKRMWSHVSIGIGVIYGLDATKNIFRSNPLVISGKNSISSMIKLIKGYPARIVFPIQYKGSIGFCNRLYLNF